MRRTVYSVVCILLQSPAVDILHSLHVSALSCKPDYIIISFQFLKTLN